MPSQDTGQRYATPTQVRKLAKGWTEEQLECRLYGHNWKPVQATFHSQYRYWYQVQQCPRCSCKRHAELSEAGHMLAQWMEYPAGYLAVGVGRIVADGRDVLRLAALQRIYPTDRTKDLDITPHSSKTRAQIGLLNGN